MNKTLPLGVRKGEEQRGQVVVIFALCLFIIIGMAAVAVDGGYGMVQQRRAQNAADFGAVAGTKMLANLCRGGNPPLGSAIVNEIQSVINLNSADVGANWTAYYLDATGADIPNNGSTKILAATAPPPTACGVRVDLSPNWRPYIAGIVGSNSLSTKAVARSVNNPNPGNGIGIVALDEVNPHQVMGGGSGTFDVFGTIFANSAVPYHPWDGSRYVCTDAPNPTQPLSSDPKCAKKNYVDVVDAKDGSSLILHGTMQTVSGNFPLDWCFGDTTMNWADPDNGGPPNKVAPTSPPNPDPYNTALCGGTNKVTLQYDLIQTGQSQIVDPLAPSQGGINDPFQKSGVGAGFNDALCPPEGSPPARVAPAAPDINGVYQLFPGEYAAPVILVGKNVHLNDCGASGYPGAFRFDGGLDLSPGAGQTVTGSNVMIATSAPVPVAGNVPGSIIGGVFKASGTGNGAPCFPEKPAIVKWGGNPETDGSHACGGTAGLPNGQYFGVITRFIGGAGGPSGVDANVYGTGNNFSLILGGKGSIKLDSPSSGPFRGVAIFQDRNTQGNFGMDAEPNDSSSVVVNGLVYNASDPCLGYPMAGGKCTNSSTNPLPADPYHYWDDGIPFKPGGVMQAGLGSGVGYPNTSGGTVTVNGPCVVADFNTDGGTTIKIDGRQNTFALPGVIGSGNPPVTG
ncbi:MAG: hypothetical protein QOK05_2817 [Chloroflexota bacterium]|jgi:hypothetical protein|nr:hypothetical protein [Chloroflexota bacterium]